MAKQRLSIEEKTIQTPVFRVSYPHLTEKQGPKGSEPSYNITMLFSKEETGEYGTDQFKKFFKDMRRVLIAVATEEYGKDMKKWPKTKEKQSLLPATFIDGDTYEDLAYKDHFVVRAKNKKQMPMVKDRLKNDRGDFITVDDEEEITKLIYPGCYARAMIKAWAFTHEAGGARIGFNLEGVQFVKHGKRLGSGGNVKFTDDLGEDDGGEDETDTSEEE